MFSIFINIFLVIEFILTIMSELMKHPHFPAEITIKELSISKMSRKVPFRLKITDEK